MTESDNVAKLQLYSLIDKTRRELHKNGTVGSLIKWTGTGEVKDDLEFEEFSPKEFSKAWLLTKLFADLLDLTIEDDRIDVRKLYPVRDLFDKLISDKKYESWVVPELEQVFELLLSVSQEDSIKAFRADLIVQTIFGSELRIPGWIPQKNEPQLPVSSNHFEFVPVLEESLSNSLYSDQVINTYTAYIKSLVDQHRGDRPYLCFIEKDVGPIGALGMLGALVEKTGLDAFVYRAGFWPDRAFSKYAGSLPKQGSNVILVYDLLVTGGALRQVAKNLYKEGAKVISAVVLFGYDKPSGQRSKYIKVGDSEGFTTEAIAWYEDYKSSIRKKRKKPDFSSSLISSPLSYEDDSHYKQKASNILIQARKDDKIKDGHHIKQKNGRQGLKASVRGESSSSLLELETMTIRRTSNWFSLDAKPYHPAAIANEFWKIAIHNDELVTLIRVQALTYLAHGWHFGIEGTPLINEHVIAQEHGPVIFTLFINLIGYGNKPIREPVGIKMGLDNKVVVPAVSRDDEDTHALLEAIWEAYRSYSDDELATLTTSTDSPWYQTLHDTEAQVTRGACIDVRLIKEYFLKRAKAWELV